jgi:cyclase
VKPAARPTRRGLLAQAAAALLPLSAKPAPGIWIHQGDFLTTGQSNSTILEMQDYLVVVDSNSPSGARAVAELARRVSPKPVRYVLLTHHHGDHIYGSALWTRAGAVTVAHASMLAELARLEPARWRAGMERDPALAALGNAPEPPKQTFDDNLWVLEDRTRRIEVRRLGPAHTRDDVVVYLPREQVLCAGDTVLHQPLNFFRDSDFPSWLEVLKAEAALPVKQIIPGHGTPAGPELITLQRQFLELLRDTALASRNSGQSAEAAAAALQIPDQLRPWAGPNIPFQLVQLRQLLK